MENNIREFTCNDCQEVTKVDWSKVRPDIDDGTSNIEIYEKGNNFAYYGECENCGNLVEIEPPVPELVVDNVDVSKDGISVQITDTVTNRSCWIDAWKDNKSGEWEYDFNQYIFHLDNDNDIVAKMFQEDLSNYAEDVFDCVMGAIDDHEDEYNKLQESKTPAMRERLKEAKARKLEAINNKLKEIVFDLFDSYEDVEDIIDSLRSLNSIGEITSDEYDEIMDVYDELLNEWENKDKKVEAKSSDVYNEIEKEAVNESAGDKSQEETLDEAINRAHQEEIDAINTYDTILSKTDETTDAKLVEMIEEIKADEEDHKLLLQHYIETGEALTDDELEELKNSSSDTDKEIKEEAKDDPNKYCALCGKEKEDYEASMCDDCWEKEKARLSTDKEIKEEAVNDKTGTYWSGNGKYQDLLRKINNKLVPETGTVAKISGIIPEDLFAKFVDLQNEYYRLFNDGDIPKVDQDYFMTDTVSDLPREGVEEAHKREEDRVNDVIKSIMLEVPDIEEKLTNNVEESKKTKTDDVIEYFGMQDNTDEKFKANVEKEYTKLRSKYPDKEMILNGDFGTYLGTEKATPIEKGEYITVYEEANSKSLDKHMEKRNCVTESILNELEDYDAKLYNDVINTLRYYFDDKGTPVEETSDINNIVTDIQSKYAFDYAEAKEIVNTFINDYKKELDNTDNKKYSKEDIKNLLDNGNIIKVGGKLGNTPSKFLIKDNKLYFQNVEITGETFIPHQKSVEEMIDYIYSLQDDGFSITSQDWDDSVKIEESKSVKTEAVTKTEMQKTSELSDIEIIENLEGGELVITDVADWDKVIAIASDLSRSQGFYGRLLRDMKEAEEDYGGKENLPFPITM